MASAIPAVSAGLLVISLMTGCQLIEPDNVVAKSPLRPFKMAEDGVALDVVYVRYPAGDSAFNEVLWKASDESQLSPQVRSELTKAGIRAGVLSSQLPAPLERLLLLPDDSGKSRDVETAEKLEFDAPITRHSMHLRPGGMSTLTASRTYESMTPLWLNDEGGAGGGTYTSAQCVFEARAFPDTDGRVQLKLVPQLLHGKPTTDFVTDPGLVGMVRPQARKGKHVFSRLAMEVTLSRGQMLVLSNHTDRPGSIGHYFFTDNTSGSPEQKLILVRLAESKWDELFAQHTRITDDSAPAKEK